MKRLTALGISIGVLAGLFTWFAGTVTQLGSWQSPFFVWVGFAAWACFYAVGGGTAHDDRGVVAEERGEVVRQGQPGGGAGLVQA